MVQHQHLVGHLLDEAQVLLDDGKGVAGGFHVGHQAGHAFDVLGLHTFGGFVQQRQRGLQAQRAGKREQLALAAAQQAGALLQALAQARKGIKQRRSVGRSGPGTRLRRAPAGAGAG